MADSRRSSRNVSRICETERAWSTIRSTGESVKLGSYRLPLPRSRILRIVIGVLLILGGIFAILPIFGFWMVPLGLLVLSVDIPRVRRWRRRFAVWFSRRYPRLAAKLHVRQRRTATARHEVRRLKPLALARAFLHNRHCSGSPPARKRAWG